MAGSTSRKTGFTIRLGRRKLEFDSRQVMLETYCSYCKGVGDDPYCPSKMPRYMSRRNVAKLLRGKVGKFIELGGWSADRKTSSRVRVGCQSFSFTPSEMRRVRRWALRP